MGCTAALGPGGCSAAEVYSLELSLVTALVLAVQCKYQRIQGLFKWLPHGESTNYKAFLVMTNGLNIEPKYWFKWYKLHLKVLRRKVALENHRSKMFL